MSEILKRTGEREIVHGLSGLLDIKNADSNGDEHGLRRCSGGYNRGVVMGVRGPIRLARSDDYGFLNDLITLRATSRYDFQVHDPGDASNAGSYVALETAS